MKLFRTIKLNLNLLILYLNTEETMVLMKNINIDYLFSKMSSMIFKSTIQIKILLIKKLLTNSQIWQSLNLTKWKALLNKKKIPDILLINSFQQRIFLLQLIGGRMVLSLKLKIKEVVVHVIHFLLLEPSKELIKSKVET